MAIAIENYREFYVKNGGSNNMAVDGTTPVVFTLEDLPGSVRYNLVGVTLYMEAAADFDSTKFGSLTALTNGLLFESGSTILSNVKDNADLMASFPIHQQNDILNTNPQRHILARAIFVDPLVITDPISITVQDDLSALDVLRVAMTLNIIPEGT